MNLKQFNWSSEEYDGLFEKKVPSQLLQNPLLQKDIWQTKEDLGLETHEHQKFLTINFRKIQPSWLNLLAKLYVLTRANLKLSIQYIANDVGHLRKFAKFLKEKHIDNIKYINNDLFEDFITGFTKLGSKKEQSLFITQLWKFFLILVEQKAGLISIHIGSEEEKHHQSQKMMRLIIFPKKCGIN